MKLISRCLIVFMEQQYGTTIQLVKYRVKPPKILWYWSKDDLKESIACPVCFCWPMKSIFFFLFGHVFSMKRNPAKQTFKFQSRLTALSFFGHIGFFFSFFFLSRFVSEKLTNIHFWANKPKLNRKKGSWRDRHSKQIYHFWATFFSFSIIVRVQNECTCSKLKGLKAQ